MNVTQELNTARAYFLKGIECLNNVETVFGIKTTGTSNPGTNPGVVSMSQGKRTLTLAARRKISKAQKSRWAARDHPATPTRTAVG